MFSIPFNETGQTVNKVMFLRGIEDLNCSIYELNETQEFGLPEFPLDDGTFIGDTVYNIPKRIDLRVLVKDSEIPIFLASLKEAQFSNQRFTVTSVAGETFINLKIMGYSKSVTSNVVGSTFYLISLREVPLVKALVESYQTSKKAGYTDNKNVGTKDGQQQKQTALKGFTS